MTKKQVFKNAAKLIANGDQKFSCLAVLFSTKSDHGKEIMEEYIRLTSPRGDCHLWITDFEGNALHRSLALLLAGEIL